MLLHTCVDGREAPMLPRDCDACMRASHEVALQGIAELTRRYDDLRAGYREWIAKADAARAEVARLREALENAADDGHSEMCVTMRLYRGCTCHQQETLKALGWACPACDGEGAIVEAEGHGRRRCAVCDASGYAALGRTGTPGDGTR